MRKSYLWAGLISLVIAGWLFHTQLLELMPLAGTAGSTAPVPDKPDKPDKPFKVLVRRFAARPRNAEVIVRGHTRPLRTVEVRARTNGIVEASPRREGDPVTAGEVLCRLDNANRNADLAQAKAQLAAANRDFEAARRLVRQNFVSRAKLASEKARRDAALAAIDRIKRDIGWTRVRAPLDAIIAVRPAEQGSYLQAGQLCATLIVLDPLIVAGAVSENEVRQLHVAMPASARLVGGQTLKGAIRHISPSADTATRTFQVELEVANPGHRIRAGMTAEIHIPLPPRPAHLLPGSLIGLDDRGRLGVWSLAAGDTVRFIPVKIIAQTRAGAWVSGLSDDVTLITRGQYYVLDGQKVTPVVQPGETGATQS